MSSGKCSRCPQKEKKFPTTACFCVFPALFGCPEEGDNDSAHLFSPCGKLAFGLGRGKEGRKKVIILGILYEILNFLPEISALSKSCVSFLVP